MLYTALLLCRKNIVIMLTYYHGLGLFGLEDQDKNLKNMVLDPDFDARPKKVYYGHF